MTCELHNPSFGKKEKKIQNKICAHCDFRGELWSAFMSAFLAYIIADIRCRKQPELPALETEIATTL